MVVQLSKINARFRPFFSLGGANGCTVQEIPEAGFIAVVLLEALNSKGFGAWGGERFLQAGLKY
ncbi:hypothetical protein D9M73_281170 [compost metagenome]